jgi:septal ring factor EnvC (AmiA/AmiB activator)
MTAANNTIDHSIISDSFHGWREEQETLQSQLDESLAALTAYQSHLDAWQSELAAERDSLRKERDEIARERISIDDQRAQLDLLAKASGQSTEQNSALSKALVDRTDELRQMDRRRGELTTDLQLSQAREKELAVTLEKERESIAEQKAKWEDENRRLRERLKREMASPNIGEAYDEEEEPGDVPPEQPSHPTERVERRNSNDNPVLGSIIEQFGKLRQQRASNRQKGPKSG